ncbi:hypothetical protein ACFZBE_39335 [Streptomyces sp. NPDC008061]|uniref:hypothetical protein n=1 Tax=Streptomyces sp. NPDC008061 TaxID=3364805 RepID=UPI0036F06C9F
MTQAPAVDAVGDRAAAEPLSVRDEEHDVEAGLVSPQREHPLVARLMPQEAEVPKALRLEAELPGEVNSLLWRRHNTDAVAPERIIEVYRELEVSRGAAFTGDDRQAQVDAVAQYLAELAELERAANVVTQPWGADVDSGADVQSAHKNLVQKLGESFHTLSAQEQALDIAVQVEADRNAAQMAHPHEAEAAAKGSAGSVQTPVQAPAGSEKTTQEGKPPRGVADGTTRELNLEERLPGPVRKRLEDLHYKTAVSDDQVIAVYRALEESEPAAFKPQEFPTQVERVAEHIANLNSRLPGVVRTKTRVAPSLVGIPEEDGTTSPATASGSAAPRVIRGTTNVVPIGTPIEQAQPPSVDDRQPPAPVASKVPRVQFRDGRQMPPYMAGDVNDWLPGLPTEVRDRSFAFGHSKRELRGADLAAREIVRQLAQYAGTKPKGDGSRLQRQMITALQRDPRGLFADGERFVYKTANGSTLVLQLQLRTYGNWRQVQSSGNPIKIESMEQFTTTSGLVVSNGTAWGLTPSIPLGVWSAMAWWARFSVQIKFGKQMDYDLNKQTEIEDKTQTKSARPYLDDVRYEFSVVEKAGRPVDVNAKRVREGSNQQVPNFGFAMRDGIQVWLDQSLTSTPSLGDNTPPATLDMGRRRPQIKITEAYGPMMHVGKWALEQIGVPENSSAAATTREFFSSERFHEMSQSLEAGEVVSPLLRGGRSGSDPLGFFSVRVKSGHAALVSVAEDAEITHTVQSHVPNGRAFRTFRSVEVSAAAGPAFELSNEDHGIRASAGPSITLGSSKGRATELAGSASVKVGAKAKEVVTGLYWVHKEITVTAPYGPKASTPKPAKNASGHRTLRKSPPRWMGQQSTETFHTWTLERLTLDAARRQVSDAEALPETGQEVPLAPPYLTEVNPPTLGMSRVEEITFAGGSFSKDVNEQTVTFLDHFRDALMRAIHEKYPNLIALDEHLSPDDPRWSSPDEYETALYNRLQVHKLLEYHRVTSSLGVITAGGDSIALIRSRTFMRGSIYVRLGATLSGRRYEGRQEGLWISHSRPASKSVTGQQGASHSVHAAVEASLALRDVALGMSGGPLQTESLSLGVRAARRWETASGYGVSAIHEPNAQGTGAVHRWRYDITFKAEVGGYEQPRLRHLIPGASASAFVFEHHPTALLEQSGHPDPRAAEDLSTPGLGEVLLSVPVEHTPLGPETAVAERPKTEVMTAGDARSLVMGTRQQGEQSILAKYPYQVISVAGSKELDGALRTALREASGGSWKLTTEPAPALAAALRRVEPTWLSGNFEETSSPTGLRTWGIIPTRLILPRQTLVVHRTSFASPLVALTPAIDIQSGDAIGNSVQAVSRSTWTNNLSTGAQLSYSRSATQVGPVVGTSAGIFPYLVDSSRSETTRRAAYGELNVSSRGRHFLVTADVAHEIATASSRLGERMHDTPYVPSLGGVAGQRVTIPRGVYGHMREADAHLHKVVTDHLGEVPRYSGGKKWRPLLVTSPFASWPANSLDIAEPLAQFQRELDRLGLAREDLEQLQRLVSHHVMLAVGKGTTGRGTSMPARIGRWGSQAQEWWFGKQKVRLRVTLQPDADRVGTFDALGHSLSMNDYAESLDADSETQSHSSGAVMGRLAISTAAATGNAVAGTVGSTYSQSDFSKYSSASTQTRGSISASNMSIDGPYAEYTTPYELLLEVESTGVGTDQNPHKISSKTNVGGLTERFPLSLMRVDSRPSQQEPAVPEFREPQEVRRAGDEVRAAVRDGRWHEVKHLGDGAKLKPFKMPDEGYVVRGIIGQKNLKKAIIVALGAAYRPSLSLPQDGTVNVDLLARAMDTPLTRPGTGAAQSLEDATSNLALTAFYDRTLRTDGYKVEVSTRTLFGGADGQVTLYSKPDLSKVRILTIADDVQIETFKQTRDASSSSFGRVGLADHALDAGPAVATGGAGTSQLGSGPAAQGSDSVRLNLSGQSLSSVSATPNGGKRVLLLAVPTTFVIEASVHHYVQESAPVRIARSPFGQVQRQPQVLQAETTVLAWATLEQAALLGLTRKAFPPQVAKSWDAVDELQKSFTNADKAYWDLRRNADGAALHGRLLELQTRVTEVTARMEREVEDAEDALAHLREAEFAHDGWGEEGARQIEAAVTRLRQARLHANEEIAAASDDRDAVQAQLNEVKAQLLALRQAAESLVEQLADAREHADWLTRTHQEVATGSDQHGDVARTDLQDPASSEVDPAYVPSVSQERSVAGDSGWSFATVADPPLLIATLPDSSERVFDLHTPGGTGNKFYEAVWMAGGFRTGSPGRLAKKAARPWQLLGRTDINLDPDAVFDVPDLEQEFPSIFRADPGLSIEIIRAGGRLPVALFTQLDQDPSQRASLISLHLRRAYRWDEQMAAVAASLAVQHLPRDLIVVEESGSHQYHAGAEAGSGVSPALPVIVYRRGDAYLAAVPRQPGVLTTDPAFEAARRAEIGDDKRPQRDVPSDLYDDAPANVYEAAVRAVRTEPSLQDLEPVDVVRALEIWNPSAISSVDDDTQLQAKRTDWYSDLAAITRELRDEGEVSAEKKAAELAQKYGPRKIERRGGGRPPASGMGETSALTDGSSQAIAGLGSSRAATSQEGLERQHLPLRVVRHTRNFDAAQLGLDESLQAALADPNQDPANREDLLADAMRRVKENLGHFQPTDNVEVVIKTTVSHLVVWMTVAQELADTFNHAIHVAVEKSLDPVRICPNEKK